LLWLDTSRLGRAETHGRAENAPHAPSVTADEFLPAQFPTIFTDGFWNVAVNKNGVIKIYLVRNDPAFNSSNNRLTVFSQLVVPIGGFIASVIFLEKQLKALVADGHVSQQQVDEARAILDANSDGKK
jgi:hypothetical protein